MKKNEEIQRDEKILMLEREEILKHKYYESEKAGKDIGPEKAILDWILKHRKLFRESLERKSE